MALINCPECGKEISNNALNCPNCGFSLKLGAVGDFISQKSRLVAFLLCLFLGGIAAHRFYVGKIGTGIIMILLMFTGIGEIWLIIDFIVIILGGFTDRNGLKIKNW